MLCRIATRLTRPRIALTCSMRFIQSQNITPVLPASNLVQTLAGKRSDEAYIAAHPDNMTSDRDTGAAGGASINDVKFLFDKTWKRIESEWGGKHNLCFPNEVIWLMGAPGSGKGTNTPALMRARGITNPPIVISHLLKEPETKMLMDKAEMVDDSQVLSLLLRALLKCDPNVGVVVDGFPRTEIQAEFLKFLYDKLHELRTEFFSTQYRDRFRFANQTVLYVDEAESVRRQLLRGQKARDHNTMVRETGDGKPLVERVTDTDEALIRARYKVFTQHFSSLLKLKKFFPFHLIHAVGSVKDVMRAIWQEFEYQSSLELDHNTYDTIQQIPIASKVGIHARQELVRRLETYQHANQEMLKECVSLIEREFVPIIKRHAISGSATIRIEAEALRDPLYVDIIMDVLSERGYIVSVDCRQFTVPIKVVPGTWEILASERTLHLFDVRFTANQIRGVYDDIKSGTPANKIPG